MSKKKAKKLILKVSREFYTPKQNNYYYRLTKMEMEKLISVSFLACGWILVERGR